MKDWNAQSTICRSAKTPARETSDIKMTVPERYAAVFGVNRASAAASRVADRDHNGAAAARSSTSQGARRILGDVRERVQEFELRGVPMGPPTAEEWTNLTAGINAHLIK